MTIHLPSCGTSVNGAFQRQWALYPYEDISTRTIEYTQVGRKTACLKGVLLQVLIMMWLEQHGNRELQPSTYFDPDEATPSTPNASPAWFTRVRVVPVLRQLARWCHAYTSMYPASS